MYVNMYDLDKSVNDNQPATDKLFTRFKVNTAQENLFATKRVWEVVDRSGQKLQKELRSGGCCRDINADESFG
ncbi:hypothetical protein L914_02646 [Phytophthora nicotianae]|uniref:Uncharacterized protein n=1 Tax=Phytophthora nicotianae TaxID=4792 RepID=W2P1W5_PHYNI|nr:hypothetical protein L914_02646 [Phytophthora nicotianae]